MQVSHPPTCGPPPGSTVTEPRSLRVRIISSLGFAAIAIVGRVDLKNDRQSGVLRVQAAWAEPDAPAETAARLAGVLRETAAWQGLNDIEVVQRGNLADGLSSELRG